MGNIWLLWPLYGGWLIMGVCGDFLSHGDTSKAGWFRRDMPMKMDDDWG